MNDGSYDVAVVGGGPAGLAAAIAFAQSGGDTVLIARRAPYADNRTTALLGASVDFLQDLHVWPRCENKAAALKTMRLVDDTGRLIRAPEVSFACDEIGLETFGYNVENHLLVAALEERAAELTHLVRIDEEAQSVSPQDAAVAIHTAGGNAVTARLLVGADGRHSLCRKAAGIAVTSRDLGQAALTFNVSHRRPHRNASTEFHTPRGPCVFVPLPGDRCSVVWVASQNEAERLYALSDEALFEREWCVGAIDSTNKLDVGHSSSTWYKISGWSLDRQIVGNAEAVIFTDEDGRIVGIGRMLFGEPMMGRVFNGYVNIGAGRSIIAYAFGADRHHLCQFGKAQFRQ